MDEIDRFGLGALYTAQAPEISSANPATHADARPILSREAGGELAVESCVVHGGWRRMTRF